MIGKRKRDTSAVSRSAAADVQEDTGSATTKKDDNAQDLFRKFFEAQFQPLEVSGGRGSEDSEPEEDDDDENESGTEESGFGSEWGGVSEDEDGSNKVVLVEHQDPSRKTDDLMDKKARKAFMNAKPPSFSVETTNVTSTRPKNKKEDDDKEIDADDLKNDLALQRLLKESHLLESASELDPTGKNRLKALDLRMQSLGATTSLYKQNMPSSHRRGIKAKAEKKDDRRRREAKENGIILEKPTGRSKPSAERRERGVGGPSIGTFAGGTLNLSKRDLSAMQGPPRSTRGRGGKRGRGRR